MTHTSSPSGSPSMARDDEASMWTGWIVFGSMMMIMLGTFHAIQGLVAILRDEYYLVGEDGLTVEVDFTTWGWTHLVVGAIVVATGIAVLYGQTWARLVGVVIAMLSAIVNIAFLSAYPIWSTMTVAFDVLIIWALTVHGDVMKAYRGRGW